MGCCPPSPAIAGVVSRSSVAPSLTTIRSGPGIRLSGSFTFRRNTRASAWYGCSVASTSSVSPARTWVRPSLARKKKKKKKKKKNKTKNKNNKQKHKKKHTKIPQQNHTTQHHTTTITSTHTPQIPYSIFLLF